MQVSNMNRYIKNDDKCMFLFLLLFVNLDFRNSSVYLFLCKNFINIILNHKPKMIQPKQHSLFANNTHIPFGVYDDLISNVDTANWDKLGFSGKKKKNRAKSLGVFWRV
jgi:hypothetical protein